jgi:hypothetical protein
MSDVNNTTEHWEPCPPGLLAQLQSGLCRRRRLAQLSRMGTRASVLLLAVGAVWFFTGRPAGPAPQAVNDLTCRECHAALVEFSRGPLSPELTARVRLHLAGCERCREFAVEQRFDGLPQAAARRSFGDCPACSQLGGPISLASMERLVAQSLWP